MMKRKVIALVLSAGMILGSASVRVWAEENTQIDSTIVTEQDTTIGAVDSVMDAEKENDNRPAVEVDKENATKEASSYIEEQDTTTTYEEIYEGTEDVSNPGIDASYADSMPDNDELMAGYIQQLFSTDSTSLMGMNEIGPMILSGNSLVVYNCMAEKIKEIACGNTDQAIIEIPISLFDVKMSLTSEELGQTWTYDATNGYQGIDYTPLYAQLDADFSLVMDCLLRDFPYEMYWYDKTGGFTYSSPGASASISRSGSDVYGDIHFADDAHYTITMDVAEVYRKADSQFKESGNGRLFYYEVDTTNITRVNTALSNADSILHALRRYDDYSKLLGYKTAICEFVDYNYPAAEDNTTPFGDPWQLVYVFDGDPDTKVVCEGYSKAFQYLCNKTAFSNPEIMCYIVTGTMQGATGAGGHMWNIVHMDDGKNYIVDVTNSDDGSVGSRGGLFLNGMTYMLDTLGNGLYTANSLSGSNHVYYWYDEETEALFSEEQLTLSATDYTYTGTGEPEPDEEVEAEIFGYNTSVVNDGTFRVSAFLRVPYSYETGVYVQSEFADLYSATYGSGDAWMRENSSSLQPYERGDDCAYYEVYFLVNSGELTRSVHFSIKNADNELLDEVTVSASEILYYYLSDEFNTDSGYSQSAVTRFKNIAKAALNYGSAAQAYFGIWYGDDGKLANADLSALDKQVAPITNDEFISGDIDFRIPEMNDQLKGVTYVGSSLILQDEIMIRHYFLPDEGEDFNRLAVIHNREVIWTYTKGDLIYVEYPVNYSDPRFMDTLDLCCYKKGGVEEYSVFTYSLMNYYGRVYTTSQNEALVSLLTSLYRLGETLE